MDINPLSLLEVTMASDPVEEEDDDCIILDPPIETHIIEDTSDPPVPEPEPEIDASAGLHFLQSDVRLEDPLALERPSRNPAINKSIPFLWVSTNVNNLATATTAELEFRKSHYKDVHNVLEDRLHCTICQDHIGCDVRVHPKSIEHPVLKVLICEKCLTYYKNLQFTLNDKGKETRCRWCGKSPMGGGSTLQRCHQCPFSFCELCLHHNLPSVNYSHPTWTCCVCNMKQLWPARSLLWALQTLKNRVLNRSGPRSAVEDISSCAQRCRENNKGTHASQKLLLKRPAMLRNNRQQRVNGQNSGLIRPQMQLKFPMPSPHTSQAFKAILNTAPAEERNIKMKTTWLTTKLESYERDILNMANKIKKIRENLLENEHTHVINTKVETVTTLLSLNSNLFKDCSLNLMNDWKEKKSRHSIECMNMNLAEKNPPLPRENSRLVPTKKIIPPKTVRKSNGPLFNAKRSPAKSKRKINKPLNQVLNKSFVKIELSNLIKEHRIKDCFVRLERLPNKVIEKALSNEQAAIV